MTSPDPSQRDEIRQAREDAILAQLESLADRLETLESFIGELRDRLNSGSTGAAAAVEELAKTKPISRLDRVERTLAALRDELARVDQRAAYMRLDRQLRIAPRWIKQRVRAMRRNGRAHAPPAPSVPDATGAAARALNQRADPKRIGLVCPIFPGGDRAYAGQFLEKRALHYRERGYHVTVFEIAANPKGRDATHAQGVRVIHTPPDRLAAALGDHRIGHICAHQLEKPAWTALRPLLGDLRMTVWVHGFEARDWREVGFNWTHAELETLRPRLEEANQNRREVMAEVFGDRRIQKVFVSRHMQKVAEAFAETRARNARVIHNVIDARDFPYAPKSQGDRAHVLWVRSFSAKNYANDLAAATILSLRDRPFFSEMSFTVYGDGKLFDDVVAPLRELTNVTIHKHFLSTAELARAHREHGVMLVPTRWDSQGLTLGEAMSSGLVAVTNAVAAIPEFADNSCAIVCPAEDVEAMADGVERLYRDPDLFLRLSKAAARRAQHQCGVAKTIEAELQLLR